MFTKKKFLSHAFLMSSLFIQSSLTGPHKINIEGASILKVGNPATYEIIIKNVGGFDLEDVVVHFEGCEKEGLEFISTVSEMMVTKVFTADSCIAVEARLKKLSANRACSFSVKTRAGYLKSDEELKSFNLQVTVTGENFRKGTLKKSVTLYSDFKNSVTLA